MSRGWDLDLAIERVLTAGLLLSAVLLVGGLALGRMGVLRAAMIVLMLTPVARVVVLTIGLLKRRDYLFGLISLWILGVLASGMYVAFFLERRPHPPSSPAAPRARTP